MFISLSLFDFGVAGARGTAAVMAGECPDPAIGAVLERGLDGLGRAGLVPNAQVTAAVARVHSERALVEARRLFTRTNFAGCISLLSIAQGELARSLAEPVPAMRQRAYELLARVMLWLGICQWAAGEPQAAAASFVGSAQLPSSPQPDPAQLPPELVSAYRAAVAEPRTEVICQLEPPLSAADVQVDGKGPTVVDANRITVPGGQHHLVMRVKCAGGGPCTAGQNTRALRLVAAPGRCRVQVPSVRAPSHLSCIAATEGADVTFVARVTQEARASRTLVVAVEQGGRVNLRLHRGRATSFAHQLVSSPRQGETAAQVVARTAPVLLGRAPAPPRGRPGPVAGTRWYRKWWVWTVSGAVAVAIVTSIAVVATRDDRVRVVFGR